MPSLFHAPHPFLPRLLLMCGVFGILWGSLGSAAADPPALEDLYREQKYQRGLPFELDAPDTDHVPANPGASAGSPGASGPPGSPGNSGPGGGTPKPNPVCIPGTPGPGEQGCDPSTTAKGEDGEDEVPGDQGPGGDGKQGDGKQNKPIGIDLPPKLDLEIPANPMMTPKAESAILLPLLLLLGVLGVLLLIAYILVRPGAAPTRSPQQTQQARAEEAKLIETLEHETQGLSPHQWAQQVDYDRAIHALLLRALKALIAQRHALHSPSLTSRELLGHAALDQAAKARLHTLVVEAELIRFARIPADKARYDACTIACAEFLTLLGATRHGGDL